MRILLFGLFILLSACSGILPQGAPAAQRYTLNVPVLAAAAQRLPYQLEIQQPQAAPGLDNDRIAVRRAPNRLDYFADSRWTGDLNTLLQSQLVAAFDNVQALQAVGNDLVGMNKDYSLLVEVRAFEAVYTDGAPAAHVKLVAKLIRLRDHTVIGTTVYDETQLAETNRMAAIITAMDNAWQQAGGKLVQANLQILAQQ